MKKHKKVLSLIFILFFTYVIFTNSSYSKYSIYILYLSLPIVSYYTYLTSNINNNSETQTLYKDENFQLIVGFFLIIGLIMKYFDFNVWKYIIGVGIVSLLIILIRRSLLFIKK